MKKTKLKLTNDQVDSIMISELKAHVEMNLNEMPEDKRDLGLIDALLRVIKYYSIEDDYNEYLIDLVGMGLDNNELELMAYAYK